MGPGEFSSCVAIVMAKQAAEEWSAADGANIRHFCGRQFFRWIRCCGRHCSVSESLVGAMFVVEASIRFADVVEMVEAEA